MEMAPPLVPSAETSNTTLREKLILAQEVSSFDSMRPYLPINKAFELIEEKPTDLPVNIGRFIDNNATLIYLILVYMNKTERIGDFERCELGDRKLPIEYTMDSGVITTIASFMIGNVNVTDSLSPKQKRVFELWRPAEVREFCDTQWTFIAPLFQENRKAVRRFPPQMIFPFEVLEKPEGTAFNKVWKIRINKYHSGLSKGFSHSVRPFFHISCSLLDCFIHDLLAVSTTRQWR